MTSTAWSFLLAIALSFALSAALTPGFGALATRTRLVVAPRTDRWHRLATPLLGGAAIALAALIALAVVSPSGRIAEMVVVLSGAAFALGLLDDFRGLAPTTKLVGQALIGAAVAFGGLGFGLVDMPPVAFIVTAVWIVALMNALNLSDNMDGLAAGIGAIAGIFLGLSTLERDPLASMVAGATAGAAAGFLVHNFYPARIFMGDAGSQFLGFMLGVAALLSTSEATAATNLGLAVMAPLAILALPIFDTLLVTVARRSAGRPVGLGGRDHSSHRLAALGLSDRDAVVLLYVVAASLATVGTVAQAISGFALALFVLALVALALFGTFLHEVDVYGGRNAASTSEPSRRLLRAVSVQARFAAEVGLDLILLTVAYYLPYVARFEGLPESQWLYLFTNSVPIVVGVQLAALVGFRVYRTLWRYLSVPDAVNIVRAIAVGTAGGALVILVLNRFEGYSRAVFLFDWLAASALIIGSRAFTVWLRHWFATRPRSGERRVLVVGANDSGAVALRLLSRAGGSPHRAVGFLDDDPGKRYRQVGGVPIVGTTADIEATLEHHRIDLVVIASEDSHAVSRIRSACAERGIECREFLAPV